MSFNLPRTIARFGLSGGGLEWGGKSKRGKGGVWNEWGRGKGGAVQCGGALAVQCGCMVFHSGVDVRVLDGVTDGVSDDASESPHEFSALSSRAILRGGWSKSTSCSSKSSVLMRAARAEVGAQTSGAVHVKEIEDTAVAVSTLFPWYSETERSCAMRAVQ
jgi:hypothetical protein